MGAPGSQMNFDSVSPVECYCGHLFLSKDTVKYFNTYNKRICFCIWSPPNYISISNDVFSIAFCYPKIQFISVLLCTFFREIISIMMSTGPNGIIDDDIDLGKTIHPMAFLAHLAKEIWNVLNFSNK